MEPEKVLPVGAAVGWFGWFTAHLAQINDILQFFLLLSSLAATWAAFVYHRSRTRK